MSRATLTLWPFERPSAVVAESSEAQTGVLPTSCTDSLVDVFVCSIFSLTTLRVRVELEVHLPVKECFGC